MDCYDNIPIVLQPNGLKTILFRHQLASIYRMETLEREQMIEYAHGIKETKIAINADPTGYGKTLSMIGLIVRNKMEWNMDTPYIWENITTDSGGLIKNREIKRYDKLDTTLILVSPSIISQWEKELSNTNLRVFTVANRRDIETIEVTNYDIILVTSPMYNNLIISFPRNAWKRFIFDEPGHLRVSGMKELIAGFYWFVTATPEAIVSQHRNCRGSFIKKIIGDGWLKFDEQFGGMILKNDINFVRASFEMPPTYHHYYKCYQPILQTVAGMVSNTVQMMIAAGNIEGAISALGGKKTRNIFEIVKQDKLAEQANIEKDIYIYREIKKNDKKLEESLKQKEKIEQEIMELSNRFEMMINDSCCICMNKLIEPILEPNCHNLFCGKCLLTWLQKSQNCPLCRNKIDTTELVYLKNNNNDSQAVVECQEHQTQIQKTLSIIKNNRDGKFLIFSSYDASFSPICILLAENNITFSEVKGSSKLRQKNIDNFRTGDTQVIFLNSSFNGAGINLQEATDIILYHEMPISTQNQIIGRANRIGRTKPLQVHHLQVGI